MPTDLQWTMNCLLAGAKLRRLVMKADTEGARELLRNLTSELDEPTIEYILKRVKEVI